MSDIRELYEHGTELYEKGNYREAELLLKQVIGLNPNYADVLNKLGVIANLNGRLEEAASHFERAITVNPAYTEASLNLSITYNEMGRNSEAYAVMERAKSESTRGAGELDPFIAGKLANEHYKLGNMYLDFGLMDEAIDEFRKALTRRPGLADIQTKLGIALRERGLYDEAISELTAARDANPYYGAARVQLGLTYYMKGHTGLAFEEWEAALQHLPGLKEAESFLNIFRDKR